MNPENKPLDQSIYHSIYHSIYQCLSAGESLVLATVIETLGSTPRKTGSRMLVFSSGATQGSVGGGELEAVVIKQAGECLAAGMSRILDYNLDGSKPDDLAMSCGGKVALLLECLSPEPEYLELFSRASWLESEGEEFWLVADLQQLSHTERKVARKLITEAKGAGDWKQSIVRDRTMAEKAPVILTEDRQQLIERMLPRETLYVFGAGHVGSETALLSSHAGFRVRLVDDRANISRLPELQQYGIEFLVLPDFQGITEKLRPGPRSYALIATRGHLFDQRVLEQLLPLNLYYTGMLGSRKKRAAMYSSMLEKGFGAEELERVYCPVGLEIGAETPAEIAVSIVAQLIQVKMGNRNES